MGTHKLSILRREGGVTKDFDLRPADFRFFIIYAHHVEPPLARRWSATSILARGCGRYLVLARIGYKRRRLRANGSAGPCFRYHRKSAPSIAAFDGWEFVRRPARKQKSPRHSRILRSRKPRDVGHPERSVWGTTSPPMTIASPELQPHWPARFSVLQV
jgi:hypothetical protein